MNITTSITLNMQTPGYVVAYEPQGNKLSRFITATLKNGSASWSVPLGATAMIRVAKPDGTFAVYDKNEKGQTAYTISGSTVTIELVGAALAAAGDALVTVMFLDSTGSNLSPFSFRLVIMPSAVSDDDIASSDYFNIFQETLDSIQQMLTETQAMYGSPLTADTAYAMTNTSKIYVYVGAESGYSYGHWYYYNGSAWVDGGVYNSEGINSNWIYEAFFTGTIENTSLAHFTDGADNVPVKALTVAINPVQSGEGDPSPDNVRPISGWTGCKLTRTGSNLISPFDGYATVTDKGITTTFDGVNVSIVGTSTGGNTNSTNMLLASPLKMFAGKTYIFAINGNWSTPNLRLRLRDESSDLWFVDSSNCVWIVTPETDLTVTRVAFRVSRSGSVIDVSGAFYCNLNALGTYEPYKGETYSVSFAIAGTVYDSTLTYNGGGTWTLAVKTANIASYNGETLPGKWISSMDVYAPGTTPTVGAQVVYELASPLTYTLSGPDVLTLLGTNNIWADCGEIEELVYRADSSLYLDNKLNATKSIIAGIETSMVATKSYSVGDLLIVGDVLYKVASPIASGATFTPGTNVNATTVAEQLILLANS